MPQILTKRSVAHRGPDRDARPGAQLGRAGPPPAPGSRPPGWRRSRPRPAGGRRAVADARLGHRDHLGRDARRQRAGALVVDLERAQVALVDPDQARPRRPGRASSSSSSCTSTSAASPSCVGRGPANRRSSSSSSAAAISSTASAPMRRASTTSASCTVKSLRSTGRPEAWRAAARSAAEPPKKSTSVRTERQAAPPAAYSLATRSGCRPGSRSPLDGDRRLISAMHDEPVAPQRAGEVAGRGGAGRLFDQVGERRGRRPRPGPVRGEDVRQVGGHDASA